MISGHNCEIINVLVGSVLPYVNILLLVRKSQTPTYFARNSFITTYYYLHNPLIRNKACKKRDHRNISFANLKKERKKWNTQNFGIEIILFWGLTLHVIASVFTPVSINNPGKSN